MFWSVQVTHPWCQRSEAPIPIAMETAKGLLPAVLQAAGYQLFPINPLAVSRYRNRYVVSRDVGVSLVRMAAGTRPRWVTPG